jgi:hypothetical protein
VLPASAVNTDATKPRKGPYDDQRSGYSPISTRPGERRLLSLLRSFTTIFLPFAFCYFLSYVFRTINGPLADELVRHFSLSAGSLGIITSAYFLAFALSAIPIGVALDVFGPRLVQGWLMIAAAIYLRALDRRLMPLSIGCPAGGYDARAFRCGPECFQFLSENHRWADRKFRCSLTLAAFGTVFTSVIPSAMIFVSWMTDWVNAAHSTISRSTRLRPAAARLRGGPLPPPYTDNRS